MTPNLMFGGSNSPWEHNPHHIKQFVLTDLPVTAVVLKGLQIEAAGGGEGWNSLPLPG